ncbi:MAG TPA: hypothetical protein VM580_31935, partial [Labilithrix sp.]|nr:hypothetical protein [Labilithrix sp.]
MEGEGKADSRQPAAPDASSDPGAPSPETESSLGFIPEREAKRPSRFPSLPPLPPSKPANYRIVVGLTWV